MGGGDNLISFSHARNHVDQSALPERMLIQLQLVDQHDGLMHALGYKADEQEQDIFFTAAQTIVVIFVFPISEMDIELSQFILLLQQFGWRSAHLGILFLDKSKIVSQSAFWADWGNERL